jgi:hypothetical protein
VFHWRKLYHEGRLGTTTNFLPVRVADEQRGEATIVARDRPALLFCMALIGSSHASLDVLYAASLRNFRFFSILLEF